MSRDEILEYPYTGVISRTIEGTGRDKDTTIVVYEGVMDEHMATDEEGRVMQTANYIISIPLTKDSEDNWIIPKKGDKIALTRHGETFMLTIDNVEPSQLGGVSIYASRSSWQ